MNTAICPALHHAQCFRRGVGAFGLFLAITGVLAESLLFSNPLVEQRADPWVHLHTDGYYYFIATAPEYDRIELRRARSLEGLRTAPAKDIWKKHESGPMSHHIWAPELHWMDDKWYVHFAAGRAEAIWDIRMYVLENRGVESAGRRVD
jgi:GH43 family beta-xylosidase